MRGYTLKIVPDILSDHLLYSSCITPEGITGYAQSVFESFRSIRSTNILNNLAELDWRTRKSGDEDVDLLADIWKTINEDFSNASNFDRYVMLTEISNISYFQPERMLKLVEFALRNPSTAAEDKENIRYREYTHNDVIHELPNILKNISYNLDYLPRCCDLLWQIGADDQRELNQTSEHPIRILKEIASYDINKPYIFNKLFLDIIIRWLSVPNIHKHFHSPFDVMEPLFAKSGNSVRVEVMKIIYTPFLVEKNVVQPIRERALKLIEDNIFQDDTKIKLNAIKCLKHVLMDPFRFSGLEISEETLKQWVPEQLHVLEMIKKLSTCNKDPLVHIAIIDLVGWVAQRGRFEEVKEKAQEIITSIEETFEFRLTRVLKNSYLHEKRYRRHEDYIKWMEQENYELAKQFLEKYPDPLLGITNLNQRLQLIKNNGIESQPEQFLGKFADINLEYARTVCESIIKNPNYLIAPYFHNIVYKIRYTDINCASALALNAVNTEDLILCRSVAFVYQTWRNCPILQRDFEIIKKLLSHSDNIVRMNAIRSVGVIAHSERQVGTNMNFDVAIIDKSEQSNSPLISLSISANIKRISVDSLNLLALSEKRSTIDIALAINIGDETELADTFCSIFDEKWGIPLEDLTDEQLNLLIRKIESVKDIDKYHIAELLRSASQRVPYYVFQALLNRIRFYENYSKDFQPLPYLGFHENIFPDIHNSNLYRDILIEIRIFALENKSNF